MDFIKTVETVALWINSCNNQWQLNLCLDAVDKFVYERFKNHVPINEMQEQQGRLLMQIADKERVIDYR